MDRLGAVASTFRAATAPPFALGPPFAAATLRPLVMTPEAARSLRWKAIAGLLVANLCWGLSFPLMKALVYSQERVLPESGSWFITACCIAPRFLLAAAVLLVVLGRGAARMTGSEWRQGLALGGSLAGGMLFQTDGLQFTSASVSAFLTQFYAIMIPLWLAARARRWPPAVVGVSSLLVLAGVGVLARFDPRTLHLGRGEAETLLSSVFFMVQILVLGRREFAANRVLPVTLVMFSVQGLVFSALAVATAPRLGDLLVLAGSAPWLGGTLALTLFCTLASFLLMNKWQPFITTTEAGLIYCAEPVFTAVMALFLPGLMSAWAGIAYANEQLTWHLLVGGGLITAANVLIQLRPTAPDKVT